MHSALSGKGGPALSAVVSGLLRFCPALVTALLALSVSLNEGCQKQNSYQALASNGYRGRSACDFGRWLMSGRGGT